MGCAPLLSPDTSRKLKAIDHKFYAEWDYKHNRWNIMGQTVGHPPRFVTAAKNSKGGYMPIDERTYSRLRKILWYNRKLRDYVFDMMNAELYAERAKDDAEYQKYKDIAAEARRPAQMLSRELGLTSGKAKLPYSQGFGAGVL